MGNDSSTRVRVSAGEPPRTSRGGRPTRVTSAAAASSAVPPGGAGMGSDASSRVQVSAGESPRTSSGGRPTRMSKLRKRESIGSSPEEAATVARVVEDLAGVPRARLGAVLADVAAALHVDLATVARQLETIASVRGLCAAACGLGTARCTPRSG